MKNYTITVSALGYVTTELAVNAKTMAEARKQERNAVAMWLKQNDVDEDSLGLAFVKTEAA